MGRSSRKSDTIALSPEHVARMKRDAPAALARRGGGWLFEQVQASVELLLVAGLSLAALWLWGASALSMLMVLLASAWIGILGEIATYVVQRRAVEAQVQAANRDLFVWHVVDAMMDGRDRVSRDAVHGHAPGLGIVVDLAFGGMATLALLAMVDASGFRWRTALDEDPAAAWTLAAIAAWQALGILWMCVRRVVATGDTAPPRFAAGGRGLGLFVLVFITLWTGDEGRDLQTALTWTYGLLLAACLLCTPGVWLMQREKRWLQAYLARPGNRGRENRDGAHSSPD